MAGPLVNSIETGLGAAIGGTILGGIYAWFVVRTDTPGRRILAMMPILNLTMPLLVKALGWIFLLNPRNGVLNVILMDIFHLRNAPFNIYGMWGITFCSALGGVSLAYLILAPALASFDPSLEEASRVAGYGPFRTFLQVTLRGILPALLSIFLLLLIDGVGALDYALILGNPAAYYTLATEVTQYGLYANPPDYGYAASISVIYIILTLVMVTIYVWVTRKSFIYAVVGGKGLRKTLTKLGKWRWLAFLVCISIFLLAFGFPFVMLMFLAFAKNFTIMNGTFVATYWLGNWKSAIALPLLAQSFIVSIEFAIAAAVLCTVLGLFISYAALKSRMRGARIFDYVGYLPLVVPGVVYSLALFWTFIFAPGISNALYGTIWPMVISVVFLFLPKSVRMISGNLVQISNELEEAPRVIGLGWWRTFAAVIVPLTRSSISTSLVYTFVDSIRQLGAVVLLATPSALVLDVLLLQLWENQAGSIGVIAATSMLITVFILSLVLGNELIQRLWRRSRPAASEAIAMADFG